MLQGRDCACGRRNFTEYQDCPHQSCLRRQLMEGVVTFDNIVCDEKKVEHEKPKRYIRKIGTVKKEGTTNIPIRHRKYA